MPHNVHKNRYANINCCKLHSLLMLQILSQLIFELFHSPDDDSRVHLSVMPGVEGSDYINANYIDVRVSYYFAE